MSYLYAKNVSYEEMTELFYYLSDQGIVFDDNQKQYLLDYFEMNGIKYIEECDNTKNKYNGDILKRVLLPPAVYTFLTNIGISIPDDSKMKRTEVTDNIFTYIKTNMLYKPDSSKECGFDKKVIIPDIKLRTLFSLSDNETLDFSSINKGVATIYNNV